MASIDRRHFDVQYLRTLVDEPILTRNFHGPEDLRDFLLHARAAAHRFKVPEPPQVSTLLNMDLGMLKYDED